MKFYCGAAREIITPPVGAHLYGYRPDDISETLHDDLTATALALSDGTEKAMLISFSLGSIENRLSDEIRSLAAKASGFAAGDIIIAATHTHTGPNTTGHEGWGDIDRPYVDSILLPAVERLAKNAVNEMVEAVVGSASGKSKAAVNRRQINENGEIVLGQNPWEIYDPFMTVLSFRRADNGDGILTLVHYGCHGTTLGGHSRMISRDWPGIMTDRIEKITGTPAVFFNGAVGDAGPRLSNGRTTGGGDIGYLYEIGEIAARDAMNIYNNIKTFDAPSVKLHRGTVHLPYRSYPPLAAVRQRLNEIGDGSRLVNLERLEYSYYTQVEKQLLQGSTAPGGEFAFQQTILELGNTVLIPFPFETFSEISLRLRRYSGFQNTLILSLANGCNGYLPTRPQLCRGGYEVGYFRFVSLNGLADDTDRNIINENLRILKK